MADISSVSPTNTSQPVSTNSATKTTSNSQLGKDDFMKLLITQMQYQDPLQPMDNGQFVAQMAQFSSLEQMQNMNTSMLAVQASNMIGSNIQYSGDSGEVVAGIVKGVNIVSGQPKLNVVIDAAKYPQYAPTKIGDFIGKSVSWTDSNKVSHTGIITDAAIVNGEAQLTAATADASGQTVKSTLSPKQITTMLLEKTVDMSDVTTFER